MNSLRDVIKLVRAGHGTPELRRILWGIPVYVSLLVLALVAQIIGKPASASANVLLGLWIGLMVMYQRGAVISEAFDAAIKKGVCTRCLYSLPTSSAACPECGLDAATAQPPRPFGWIRK